MCVVMYKHHCMGVCACVHVCMHVHTHIHTVEAPLGFVIHGHLVPVLDGSQWTFYYEDLEILS